MKIKYYLATLLLSSPVFMCAQVLQIEHAPLIWLRSDVHGSTDSIWQDCRYNGYHASSNTNQFLPTKSLFNFNETFYFDGSYSPLELNFIPGIDEYLKIYAIYQADDSTIDIGIWNLQLDSINALGLTTQYLKSFTLKIQYDSISNTIPIINASTRNWKGHPIDSTLAGFQIAGNDSTNFKGKFAEFIVFRQSLKNFDNVKIHTYLAMKYGVCLRGMNYQFSDTTIVWNANQNKLFDKEIAGIGRDDSLGIYQKQSAGNGGQSELTISVGNLSVSNDSNQAHIPNYNALIWGHNASQYSINSDTSNSQTVNFLTHRQWLIQVNGDSAHTLLTNLRLNIHQLGTVQNLMLVINPHCLPEYVIDSCIFITPDSCDQMGNYYFSNIQWDQDGSGKDMFAFSGISTQSTVRILNPNLTTTLSSDDDFYCLVFPNPTEGYFTVSYSSEKETDVVMVLRDATGRTISTQIISSAKEFEIVKFLDKPGLYFLSISNTTKTQTYKIIVK